MAFSRCLLITLAFLLGGAPSARADLVFTSETEANFELSFLSTGPLNGYATALGIPLDTFQNYQAVGDLTFTIDDSSPGATSMPFTSVTGQLAGVLPAPIFSTQPIEFLGGTLDNIIRDGSDNIISADVVDLSMRWEILIQEGDPVAERRLITLDGLPFSGPITGAPFLNGDEISGASLVDVFWDADLSTPSAVVRNRTLTAVPEPTGAGILLMGVVLTATRRRKNQ